MREIKFRFWDKRFREMKGSTSLLQMMSNMEYYLGDELGIRPKDKIPLQYTGLKDKNGKEIYEGDIIRWETEDGIKTGKVFYKNNVGSFVFASGQDCCGFNVFDSLRCMVVTGNIYENPELLENKDEA